MGNLVRLQARILGLDCLGLNPDQPSCLDENDSDVDMKWLLYWKCGSEEGDRLLVQRLSEC